MYIRDQPYDCTERKHPCNCKWKRSDLARARVPAALGQLAAFRPKSYGGRPITGVVVVAAVAAAAAAVVVDDGSTSSGTPLWPSRRPGLAVYQSKRRRTICSARTQDASAYRAWCAAQAALRFAGAPTHDMVAERSGAFRAVWHAGVAKLPPEQTQLAGWHPVGTVWARDYIF